MFSGTWGWMERLSPFSTTFASSRTSLNAKPSLQYDCTGIWRSIRRVILVSRSRTATVIR